MLTLRTLILALIVFLNAHAFAAAPTCSEVFQNENPTIVLNEQIAKRYPQLKFMTENPDAFIATIRERFAQQKMTNPQRAHDFDYSEIGIPLAKDLEADLQKWVVELDTQASSLKTSKGKASAIAEVQVARDYAQDLLTESQKYLQTGTVSYREVVEFSYFYSRVRGYFEARKQSPLMKIYLFIDRKLNGYKPLSISDEYALYKRRKFEVFQKASVSGGFTMAAAPFKEAFTNKDTLKTIWVPTNAALGRSIFMRLMAKDINLIGVTGEPILADGILRPSGDFWSHDVRHESGKYLQGMTYRKLNNLSEEQYAKLSHQMDQWLIELNKEIATVQDKELKEAIKLQTFNFHHDRGYPLIPSVYLNHKRDHVSLLLYIFQKTSGEGVSFQKPVGNLKKADAWLREFWEKRLSEEKDALEKL